MLGANPLLDRATQRRGENLSPELEASSMAVGAGLRVSGGNSIRQLLQAWADLKLSLSAAAAWGALAVVDIFRE
jgi:hypothetical protein